MTDIDTTENPFGKGWRILMIAIFAIVVIAIGVMLWGVLTH